MRLPLVAKPPHPLRKQLNRRASRLKRPGRRTGLFLQLPLQFGVNGSEGNPHVVPSEGEGVAQHVEHQWTVELQECISIGLRPGWTLQSIDVS